MAPYEPGDSVLWRGGVERVRWAIPHTFVADDDGRVLLYCRPGARGFTPQEAADIRTEGEHVLAEQPWPTGWEDWRPDPDWPMPTLPAGWARW